MRQELKHALIQFGGVVFAICIHLAPIALIWLFTGELPPIFQSQETQP